MTPFPRADYETIRRYDPERAPVRIDLSDNTNLWGTHPGALERIRNASTNDVARYPDLYADELRAAVSERFDVPLDSITTGAGSDDVLDSAFRAAWGPGAHISYPAPTFSMIEPFPRMNGLGARSVSWPEAEADPSLLLDGDPSLIYVCRPNNPTGHLAPRVWLDELLEARGADGPLVIIDEAYADFAEDSVISDAPRIPNLLVARTTSKAYGLAGMRCGFAVGAPPVALAVEKSRGPYKVGGLAAAASAAAVRDDEGWLPGVIRQCLENRALLVDALDRRGLQPLPSSANFVLCAAPTGYARPDALALRAAGIGVRPFSGIPELGDGLRITVGPRELMETFLDTLDRTFVLEAAS